MSNYERLAGHVSDGSLRIVNTVAVPRSISTALGRMLNESDGPSLFVNEPFNRNNRDLEVTAGHILGAAAPALRTTNSPLTLITKNMSTYMSSDTFRALSDISDFTVWSVRDPLIQMGSLLTRLANDITVETGEDKITQEELGPHLDAVTAFLQNSPLSHNFSRTGWPSIREHFRGQPRPERSIVVDGEELVADPLTVLTGACKRIDLRFSTRMIDGWQNDYTNINVGSSRYGTEENAWTRQVATSSGIVAVTREALDFDILPSALQEHITEVAIPTYQEMIHSESTQ